MRFKAYIITFCCIFALIQSACKKEGVLRETPVIGKIRLKNVSLGTAAYSISLNNTVLEDSLTSTPAQAYLYTVQEGQSQLQVRSASDKKLLLDTVIALPKRPVVTILSLSSEPGAKPEIIISDDANVAPAQRNLAFYYTGAGLQPGLPDQALPDEVTVTLLKFENANPVKVDTLAKFEHILKGKLSEFQLIDFDDNINTYTFDIRNREGQLLAPAFDLSNPYSGNLLMGNYTSSQQMIYDLQVFDIGTHFVYYSFPLLLF